MVKLSSKTLAQAKEAARENDAMPEKKSREVKADYSGYTPAKQRVTTWTAEGRELVAKMRKNRRGFMGRSYVVGEGSLATVAKQYASWDYGYTVIQPGEMVMIVSAPYNPWGDGMVVDVLRGADPIAEVPLASLRPLRDEEDDE
jgi:hypothetical protein